jgi:TRAP-type C4-dicarboxylate transport system substrate-binding protein
MAPSRLILLAILLCSTSEASAEKQVRLRLGTLAIEGSRYMTDILALSREIQTRTDGVVRLDWVTGGQLGDEVAMADLMQKGRLDGGGFSEIGLTALVPEMAAWRYPGLFQEYDEVDRATAALDASVRASFGKRDAVFAMWADLGFAHIFATRPFSGLREALTRATPWLTQPIDGRLTAAIVEGRAEAWAMPPLYMVAIGSSQQFARKMTALRYRYVIGGLVFSRAAWERMSPEQREIVLAVCREWQPRLRASWRRESERGWATLVKSGVDVHISTLSEVTTFTEASAKIRAPHASSVGLGDLTERIASAARAR